MTRRIERKICINCDPFSLKPSHYFSKVIEKVGLKEKDFKEPNKFFGMWCWSVKETSYEEYMEKRENIGNLLKAMHKEGVIWGMKW